MRLDLITIGNVCIDIFLPPHAPPPGGGLTEIDRLDVVPGGNGLNTAVAAARLGVRTAVAGVLGDDLFGRYLRDFLAAEGVDTTLLELLPERASPATIVLNDDAGERSFIHHPGTNRDYAIPPAALSRPTRIFHLAAPELLGEFWPGPCLEAARAIRSTGTTLSIDIFAFPGPGVVEAHRPVLELCQLALPNQEEARAITGKDDPGAAASSLHECGIPLVAIKRGARGARVSWRGGQAEVAAESVEAVDTCGAGDNFAGGFLAAHLRGLSPAECGRIGCDLGTRCVEHRGSLTGTADREFLEAVRRRLAAPRGA